MKHILTSGSMKNFQRFMLPLWLVVWLLFLESSSLAGVTNGLPKGMSINPVTNAISGTTMQTGTFNVNISASNAGGKGSAVLVLVILSPLDGWKKKVFTTTQLADPKISGDNATPAGDGITNLIKYALHLDPMKNGSRKLPVLGTMVSGSNNTCLTLTYTEVISAKDITYAVEVSGDLRTWNSGTGYTAQVSATNNSDGVTRTVVVQDTTPISSGSKRFLRLNVTRP